MGASSFCQIAIEACLFAIRTRCGAFLITRAKWLSRRGTLLPIGCAEYLSMTVAT
jgi:hypothetical protein